MRFTVNRKGLLQALQLIMGVADKKQAHPVLLNVLLRVSNNILELTTTDLEVELSCQTTLSGDNTAGEITVSVRKLADICRKLADGVDLKISLEGGQLLVLAGRSRFNLATLPSAEFPVIEKNADAIEFKLLAKDLHYSLEMTHFSMAQQDVRHYLNGVMLQLSSTCIRAIASNGHRLSFCDVPCDIEVEDLQLILPRKGILELMRLLATELEETVTIRAAGNHITVAAKNYTFTSKLIEGKFPSYAGVVALPKDGVAIDVERDAFCSALARASILCNEKSHGILLKSSVEDGLCLIANNSVREEAKEYVEVGHIGDAVEAGFNSTYLADVFNVLPEGTVSMRFAPQRNSVFITANTENECLYVIMPMRL